MRLLPKASELRRGRPGSTLRVIVLVAFALLLAAFQAAPRVASGLVSPSLLSAPLSMPLVPPALAASALAPLTVASLGWSVEEQLGYDDAEMPACDREGEQAHPPPDSPTPTHATGARDQEGSEGRLPQSEGVAVFSSPRAAIVLCAATTATPVGPRASMSIVEAAPESVGNRSAHPVRGPPARTMAGHRGARG